MIEFPVSSGNAHRVKEVVLPEVTHEVKTESPVTSSTALALPGGAASPPPEVAKAEVEPMEDDDNLVAEAELALAQPPPSQAVAKANFANPLGKYQRHCTFISCL